MKRGLQNDGHLTTYTLIPVWCEICDERIYDGDTVFEDNCGDFICKNCGEEEIEAGEED